MRRQLRERPGQSASVADGAPRRLDAEEIRDAMLMVSGQLDLTRPQGSPVLELKNKQIFGPGKQRRQPRSTPTREACICRFCETWCPKCCRFFDMADPNLIVGKRDVTTVPTQALYLMNNAFVLRQAESMAKHVLAQDGLSQTARIDLAYRLALGRFPPKAKKRKSRATWSNIANHSRQPRSGAIAHLAAWTSFCQTLFAAGQFRYVY